MLETHRNGLCTGKLMGFGGKRSVTATPLPRVTCLKAVCAQQGVVVALHRAKPFSSMKDILISGPWCTYWTGLSRKSLRWDLSIKLPNWELCCHHTGRGRGLTPPKRQGLNWLDGVGSQGGTASPCISNTQTAPHHTATRIFEVTLVFVVNYTSHNWFPLPWQHPRTALLGTDILAETVRTGQGVMVIN